MLAKVFSSTVAGIDAITITVEVNCTPAGEHPNMFIVGLPDSAVKESTQRISAALTNIGRRAPMRNTVVNLSPAHIRKEGSHYDLPIAIGFWIASHNINLDGLNNYIILGELSLDGSILPIRGALPIAIGAIREGFTKIIVPQINAREAAVVSGIDVYGVTDLAQVIDLLQGNISIQPTIVNTRDEYFSNCANFEIDFFDVKGQGSVKRALEIAAAGGHNVLMVGPPGSGKSMLAKRMPTITPPMTLVEALEATKIHSVAGKIGASGGLLTSRPFRAPHHIVSDVALVGGGSNPQPGEISLAHNGILFLDEMPEFSRHVLEVLRQPLEERSIEIARAKYSVRYPANFMLIGAMNPCPCGYRTHPEKECKCTPAGVSRYMSKISGPLLDRIDMHIEVIPVEINSITAARQGENSADIRARVVAARAMQSKRFEGQGIHCNAMMSAGMMEKYCALDDIGLATLKMAMSVLGLSARAYDRILKVGRTIADLDGSENIYENHIQEAISYRKLDRESWADSF